jgi:hypothetical protein
LGGRKLLFLALRLLLKLELLELLKKGLLAVELHAHGAHVDWVLSEGASRHPLIALG